MKKSLFISWATASMALGCSSSAWAGFATAVVSYNPGIATGPFSNPLTTLGGPTTSLDYGPVDPFNAPYSTNDVVTIGDGGSLTVEFGSPIRNEPGHLFGVDFLIFGNAGFTITNDYDPVTFAWIGEPATDGSLYGAAAPGVSRVSVSANGVDFFLLDPLLAPTLDRLFPGDAAGSPVLPVNPLLGQAQFAGQDLADLRLLYGGSAGGAGFDLAWAVDEFNQPVNLTEAWFVRVETLGGDVEIDAFSVVPEPSTAALLCFGALALRIIPGRRK